MDLGMDLGGGSPLGSNNASASDLTQALTRFCAQHNKAQLNPELDLVKQQLRRVEDVVHILQVSLPRVEQAVKEGETHAQQMEIQITGLKKQTTGLEQTMQTRVGNDQLMQAEKMISSLQKSVNELSQAHVVHKEGVTAQKKFMDSSVSSFQIRFTEFGQSLRSNVDRLNLIDTKTSKLDNQMEDLQLLMQERVQTSELMKVKGAVEGLQMHLADLRQSVHRDGRSMNERAEALETATSAASRQLEDVQILLQDRAHIDDMQQMKGTIDGLTSHIAILETSLEDTTSAQKKLIDGQVSNLTARLTEIGHTVRSSADQLHELQGNSAKAEQQLEDLQLLMQERVQTSELHKVKGAVDGLQLKLAYVEQAAQQESRSLQERGEQLESLTSKAERQFEELFRAVEERALLSQVSQFNGIVLDLEKQLAEARNMLQDKASMILVKQVEGSLAAIQQQNTDQAVEANTTLDQVQQLSRTLSTTHVKLSAVQEAMHSKADSDSVEQLATSLTALHTRTPGLQEEIQGCLDRVRIFENTSATLSRQVSKAETLLQRKADSHDVEQLLSSITTLESRMPSAEEDLQACMDRMHDFESTVASLSRQLGAAETILEGKVDAIQMQHFDLAMSEAQAKLGLVEQMMLDKVRELSSLLGGVDARHTELEQCLHDKAGHNQVQHLSDIINSMEIKLVDTASQQSVVQQLEELLSQAHARISHLETGMAEKAAHFQVQQVRTLLSSMESRVNMVENTFQDKADHEALQQLQEMLSSLEARLVDAIAEQAAELSTMPSQMETLEQGLEEIRELHQQEVQARVSRNQQSMVGATQVQELKGLHTATEAKLHRLDQAVQDKASGAAVQHLQGVLSSVEARLQDAIADQASHMNTVNSSQLQGLEDVCMKVQVRLSQVEKDSAERVNLGQIQQIKSLVAGLEEKMTCIEGTMHEKAGMLLFQQLQDVVTGLEEQVAGCISKQASMSGSLEQQNLKPLFERALLDVQSKVFEVEHLLQEKAGINQMQHLREAVASLETKLESSGTASSTTGSGQVQQLESVVMLMQAQLADVEHSLEEKVGMEQVQSLKNMLTSFQSQLTNLEQNMQDQVGGGIQLQQLRNQISTLEMKLAGMKSNDGAHDRSHSGGGGGDDVQQLSEEVSGLQTKVSGIKRGVWEVVDCVQTVEGAIAALKTQTANIEQTMQEKAGVGQVQQLCDTVDAMKAKIVGIDQMVRTGADRVREVEGAVMSVGSQLTGFKQVFYEGQSNDSPHSRLLLGLDDNMR